ncbi:MAG: methyltransferase domain-containing protein [Pseudomonadota bacterium]
MIKALLLPAVSALSLTFAMTATAGHHEEGEKSDAQMSGAKAMIDKAVTDNAYRSEKNIARDQYRHPAETLTFFGIEPDMTLVEVGPGGGWYTEILAPLVAEKGTYIALTGAPEPGSRRYEQTMKWRDSYIDDSGKFGKTAVARFAGQDVPFAAPNSVDAALIFRGMHGMIYYGDPKGMLAELYASLKPGGVLGIVQHRAKADDDNFPNLNMRGYVREDYVIKLVESAGFKLEAKSEINANKKDPADWERGVWTLPPTLTTKKNDRKYMKIGESDRMTLKFVKPAATESR